MNNSKTYPLSSTQEVVWLDQIFTPDLPCYNIGGVVLLKGKVDLERLNIAIKHMVSQSDVFRLTMIETPASAQQLFQEEMEFQLTEVDFSEFPDAKDRALAYIDEKFSQPFSLYNSRLWTMEWLKTSENEGYWFVCCHHLIADGFTIGLVGSAIPEIYNRLGTEGVLYENDEKVPSYLNFIQKDQSYLSSNKFEKDKAFWLERFQKLPEPLLLKTKNTYDNQAFGQLIWGINRSIFTQISELSTAIGCSTSHFFSVIMAVYFSKINNNREEIVFGMPVYNRSNAEQKKTFGMFSSVIPVAIPISSSNTFQETMISLSNELKRVYRHQRFPMSEIIRQVRSGPDDRLRLYDIALSVEDFSSDLGFDDMSSSMRPLHNGYESQPMGIYIRSLEENADVLAEFNFDLNFFSDADMRLHQQRIERLILQTIDHPQVLVSEMTLMDENERRKVVQNFNDTRATYSENTLIHEQFEYQVEQRANEQALVFENETLTYSQLNERANQLAYHLLELGVKPDTRVALCMQRSLEMVVSILATIKAGGAYVPIDPDYPKDRMAHMMKDSNPVVLLTQTALAQHLNASDGTSVVFLDEVPWQQSKFNEYSTDNINRQDIGLKSFNLAYVIYTSGSTGLPKGVMVEHESLVNRIEWMQQAYNLDNNEAVLQKTPFSFDVSVWEFFWPLTCGAKLVLARPDGHKDPLYLAQLIREQNISTLHFVPSMLQAFLVEQPECKTFKRVICSGEALPLNLAVQAKKLWPHSELYNLYGPTEACIDVTAWRCSVTDNQIPIGYPIANTQIYILDDNLQPVPVGVTGEIHIGGVGVARGYLNKAELTEEKFIADPFSEVQGARLYKTGDLARWNCDGAIEYLGRNDFQVKIRGFRIELGEIEAQLCDIDGIRESVVLARDDVSGDKQLVAYIVAEQSDNKPEPEKIREDLSVNLPAHMVPAIYVHMAFLPLTANGKLDRKALPIPEGESHIQKIYEAPKGDLEENLAQYWSKLLGVKKVGRLDSFFELGGHSLLAVQLISLLRQHQGIELSINTLFNYPVLSDLVIEIKKLGHKEVTEICLADRSEPLPLSYAQQRLWFIEQMDKQASSAYHMPGGLRLTGQLNQVALEAALNRIVERHEILRTHFITVNGQPQQVVEPSSSFFLQYQDLTNASQMEYEFACAQEAAEPFYLDTGPLIRGRLLTLKQDEHILLITMHHIISDGWSIGILTKELSLLYAAFSQDLADPLPPLSIQYADFAQWQSSLLEGPILQKQQDYWVNQLSDVPDLVNLPTDRIRTEIQENNGDSISISLDADLSRKLKTLSQKHGATLYMTLLAGWAAVVNRLASQDDVVIGSPNANRARVELEPLIGFFVNTQALKVNFTNKPTVSELLLQVKDTALAAQNNQDITFEQVVEKVNPVRSMAHSPIFQLMFSWQNTPEHNLNLGDLTLEELVIRKSVSQFDLSLDLQETGEKIVGSLNYATALFDEKTIKRHWCYLKTMLREMAMDDAQKIDEIPLLSSAERSQVINTFNETNTPYSQDILIHELFEQQVQKNPQAIAAEFEGLTLTYAQLNNRANQLARHLINQGVKPDDRVALCLERSLDMVVSILATVKAGAAYVPMDPGYPVDRLIHMMKDSTPKVCLTQMALCDAVEGLMDLHTCPVFVLDEMPWESSIWGHLQENNLNTHELKLNNSNLAYVIYTSGSTGLPKGVMIEHRSLVNRIEWMQQAYQLDNDETVLQKTPFSFDVSVWEFFWPLSYGSKLVLARPNGHKDPVYLAQLIDEQQVSTLHFVPSMLEAFLVQQPDCKSLKRVICSGEALPLNVAIQTKALWPHAQLHNLYGPTEASIDVTAWTCSESDRQVPIGYPIANTQIYILDDHLQPVPVGVAGEIFIGGVGVARGYLNNQLLTEERFINDIYSSDSADRLYKTGDLACWRTDGAIEYLGRNDFQVKIRGLRIEPGETEHKLTSLEQVRSTVVLPHGQLSDQKLVAYVVPSSEFKSKTKEQEAELIILLRQQLQKQLPDYMIPSFFVLIDEIPLTANGKVDRKALPEPKAELSSVEYHEPKTNTEQALVKIWAQLLNLATNEISTLDNFFRLGGHSLLSIRLQACVRDIFDVELPVKAIFETDNLQMMSIQIDILLPNLDITEDVQEREVFEL
ncbi:non-ribosomal peptide synthetase [Pseudoalteromonas denitrificans]|uniref:Amino acid adenylation domain-containing protein n=1 Tax=Pseudoalteromonas denitrificans DSM 6059 TaxID=1123010 RepID=A0A1I1Q0I3_9GAMM|nr:non-ribosomal peptide synthetase [Pseudoalteromonas denitrificans]SFD15634.1 amino acid adenylation domain-containing protein [Pseudoalteromonas denitrificans DSM 6059]